MVGLSLRFALRLSLCVVVVAAYAIVGKKWSRAGSKE